MAIVTDFVIIRFATAGYGFMRTAHPHIIPWLELKKIPYTRSYRRVFFDLPEDLREYTVVTEELCKKLAPFATEIKRRLSVLRWTSARKVRQPLSLDERRHLAEAGITIIL